MKDQTWQQRIDAAGSEPEVIAVARDYLATISPDEFAHLPGTLRPRKIVDAGDVSAYAFDLVKHEGDDEDGVEVVQRLAHVMSRASIRLSQLVVSDGA